MAPEAVACSCLYLRRLLDETSAGPRLVRRLQTTPSMRTTGACQVRPNSAASERCLRSCIRAVVRPCCCTFCCTELTSKSRGCSVRLPPDLSSLLALASSSRTNRHINRPAKFALLEHCRESRSERTLQPLRYPQRHSERPSPPPAASTVRDVETSGPYQKPQRNDALKKQRQ